MSQANLTIANGSGADFRAALNNALAALGSFFYGPNDPYDSGYSINYMFWGDTTNNLFKQRNAENTAWITKGTIDTNGTVQWDLSQGTGIVAIANGGTGSTTASAARTALTAAESGANSDITSLSGLTSAIPYAGVYPGSVVQVVNYQTGEVATGTTVIPIDDSIPQSNEGDEYMSFSITPKSATNKLKIDVVWIGTHSSTSISFLTVTLFKDSDANAIAAAVTTAIAAGYIRTIAFSHSMTAGTTSAITFKVRAGSEDSGTTTFNGSTGARLYGGVMASSITITEVKA
jgi:hypothetical protein